MAVLSSLPGISVTVHNAEGELPEYTDSEPDVVKNLKSPSSVVVSNYIEAPSDGGLFWLKFRVEPPYKHDGYGIEFRPEISGVYIKNGVICHPQDMEVDGSWEAVLKHTHTIDENGLVLRYFQFAKLKILPGNGHRVSEKQRLDMENIGMLQIRVFLSNPKRRKLTDASGGCIRHPRKSTPPKIEILNKTFEISSDSVTDINPRMTTVTENIAARKSLSLGITRVILVSCEICMLIVTLRYADERLDVPVSYSKLSSTHGWHLPFAIFQFKYRSRGIISYLNPPFRYELIRHMKLIFGGCC
jgi:hypothetical protein